MIFKKPHLHLVHQHTHTQTEECLQKQKMRTFPQYSPRQRPAGQWNQQVSSRCRNLLEHTELIQTLLPVVFLSLPPSSLAVLKSLCERLRAITSASTHLCAGRNPSLKLTYDLPSNERIRRVFLSRRAVASKLLSELNGSLGCRSSDLFTWITDVIYSSFQTWRHPIDGVWLWPTVRDGEKQRCIHTHNESMVLT